MNQMTTDSKLTIPKQLVVSRGVLGIPVFFHYPEDYFIQFKDTIAQVNHLLCLLGDNDIQEMFSEIECRDPDSTLNIFTTNQAALSYASKHGLLNEFLTVIVSVEDHLDGCEVCCDCAQGIAEDMACGDFKFISDENGTLIIDFN